MALGKMLKERNRVMVLSLALLVNESGNAELLCRAVMPSCGWMDGWMDGWMHVALWNAEYVIWAWAPCMHSWAAMEASWAVYVYEYGQRTRLFTGAYTNTYMDTEVGSGLFTVGL
jgi:hypothetical protein